MLYFDSPITDLINVCLSKGNPCMDGLNSLPNDYTVEMMLKDGENRERVFVWGICNEEVFDQFDKEVRAYGLSCIETPSYALHIYTTCSGLTDDEANTLLPLVYKKPEAVKLIQEGKLPSVRPIPIPGEDI